MLYLTNKRAFENSGVGIPQVAGLLGEPSIDLPTPW